MLYNERFRARVAAKVEVVCVSFLLDAFSCVVGCVSCLPCGCIFIGLWTSLVCQGTSSRESCIGSDDVAQVGINALFESRC